MSGKKPRLDTVGAWSEVKLEIVRKYAAAYSTILSRQPGFTHYYIDGFAGPGEHISRATGKVIPGSPLNVLGVQPAFDRYVLIDQNPRRVDNLKELIGSRQEVEFLQGDCNTILLNEVFPRVRWDKKQRALCLLDPYGVHLKWEVLAKAGELKTIDLMLNFPIMDMNMNALLTSPEMVSEREGSRMTAFWGDESWRKITYRPSRQGNLFGDREVEKLPGAAIVEAFCRRLKTAAGFECTTKPVAMRNRRQAVVYYLVFASAKSVACKIVGDIFDQYRSGGPKSTRPTP